MKTLIVYASKKGFTKQCAERIAEGIQDGSQAVRVGRNLKSINTTDYEACIVGGYIHAGRMSGKLRSWCLENKQLLLEQPLGLFVCGLDQEHQDTLVADHYLPELVSHASAKAYMGARLVFKDYNPLIRAMLKKIMKSDQDVHIDRPEAILDMIAQFSS